MKKVVTKYLAFIMAILLAIFIPTLPYKVQAATAKTQALKAYNKLLSQKTIPWGNNLYYTAVPADTLSFTTAYIDNDSVPELIIMSSAVRQQAGFALLYTYKNGKLQFVSNIDMNGDLYYYKKKGILIDRYVHRTEVDKYMKFSGTKLTQKLSFNTSTVGVKSYYKFFKSNIRPDDSKEISKTQFAKEVKKLTGGSKKSKIAMEALKKNTNINRTKYLK